MPADYDTDGFDTEDVRLGCCSDKSEISGCSSSDERHITFSHWLSRSGSVQVTS